MKNFISQSSITPPEQSFDNLVKAVSPFKKQIERGRV